MKTFRPASWGRHSGQFVSGSVWMGRLWFINVFICLRKTAWVFCWRRVSVPIPFQGPILFPLMTVIKPSLVYLRSRASWQAVLGCIVIEKNKKWASSVYPMTSSRSTSNITYWRTLYRICWMLWETLWSDYRNKSSNNISITVDHSLGTESSTVESCFGSYVFKVTWRDSVRQLLCSKSRSTLASPAS